MAPRSPAPGSGLHPRLTHRAAGLDHEGELPVIEGTVIRLQVDHLPGGGDPNPVWLWWSVTGATPADIDRLWQAFLFPLLKPHRPTSTDGAAGQCVAG